MAKPKTPTAETEGYDRKIRVTEGGKAVERTLNDLQIHDLWHVAQAAGHAMDCMILIQTTLEKWIIDHDDLNGTEAYEDVERLLDLARGRGEPPETARGERMKSMILDTWHLAHDFKKALAGDVS